mgnify:CR=1 FL=1|jgi:hypothetical protein
MDNFINQIKEYNGIPGKLKTFITFLFFDVGHEEINALINHKIKLVNTIQDTYKKNRTMERVYNIKKDFSEYPNDYFKKKGLIYFVNEELNKIEIPEAALKIAREEFGSNIYYDHGDFYQVPYLLDMFTNFEYYDLILIEKEAHLYHITENKTKFLANVKLDEEEIKKKIGQFFSGDYVLSGNGNFKTNFQKNNEKNIIGEFKGTGFKVGKIEHLKEQTIEFYRKQKEDKALEKMNEYFGNIHTYSDLMVFSNKRIFKFVENYAVKILFIHTSTKLYNRIIEELGENVLDSVELYLLTSNASECQAFLKDYHGAMAIMRYEMPQDCFD